VCLAEHEPENQHVLWLRVSHQRSTARRAGHRDLTPRQAQVLQWIVDGKGNEQIAEILAISAGTLRKHAERIFDKLGVDSRTAAANFYHSLSRHYRQQLRTAD
jgi:DNA-binding CsgD family transcriptional regulator